MNKSRAVVLCMSMLTLVGVAHAEEKVAKAWSDQAEVSYVNTGGNSDVTTLALKNLLKYQVTQPFSLSWKAEALNAKSNNERTADRFFSELRGDYLFTEHFYGLATASWTKDRFTGIDARYIGGIGAGYKFLTGPKHILLAEAGLTYTFEEDVNGANNNYPGGRAFAKYQYAITEKNTFSQSLEYLHDFDRSKNINLVSETAVTASLTDIFSLKSSYIVRHDGEPALGKKKTDTILGMALVANF